MEKLIKLSPFLNNAWFRFIEVLNASDKNMKKITLRRKVSILSLGPFPEYNNIVPNITNLIYINLQ